MTATPEEMADTARLREMMGGDGSEIPLESLYDLLCEYNASMCAGWLIIDRSFMDNFTGWLAHTLLWERAKYVAGAAR